MSARLPFTSRCAKAQVFTAVSMGCFTAALMRPGKYAARISGNTGSINVKVTSRIQNGGEYTTMGASRAWP